MNSLSQTAPKVLLVEDDLPGLQNLELLLQLHGFEVTTATDGLSGWQRIKSDMPDIVVCDILMPGMTGLELLAKVREHSAHSNTPFIFLTALADNRSQRFGMNLGADDYLTKPFSVDELVRAIEARLARQQCRELTARSSHTSGLTPRERHILAMIGRGLTSKQIAGESQISVRTVDAHRRTIMSKLGVSSAAALIRIAVRETLVL